MPRVTDDVTKPDDTSRSGGWKYGGNPNPKKLSINQTRVQERSRNISHDEKYGNFSSAWELIVKNVQPTLYYF